MGTNLQQLQAIRSGDVDALAASFNAHADSLYAIVYYRVGKNPELAADATQETFRIALQRLADYDSERGKMITWLRTLSRNVVRDIMRVQQRAVLFQVVWDCTDESLLAAYGPIESENLPDRILEQKETRELVAVVMANIQPQYRDMLLAKYIDNQSLESIAGLHVMTIDAVKSRLRRARSSFKETFLILTGTEAPT